MSITNSTLAADLKAMVDLWNTRETQMVNWLSGSATGGPSNDGKYPLTNAAGTTYYVDCPAKMAATISNLVTGVAASATSASSSASASASSATSASTSATSASTSATNAATSATSASTQRSLAANHEAACLSIYDDMRAWYLGPASTAPTVDLKGNPLMVGALYFNTTSNTIKVWNGTSWT